MPEVLWLLEQLRLRVDPLKDVPACSEVVSVRLQHALGHASVAHSTVHLNKLTQCLENLFMTMTVINTMRNQFIFADGVNFLWA